MSKKKVKVLVVDDVEEIVRFLSRILESEGYKVLSARNGKVAVEIVQKELPDAVIMDIKMPIMNGIEAMKKMKSIIPLLPVIFITAFGEIDSAVHAIKLGAYNYVTKPFEQENIIITLKNALNELRLKCEVKKLRSDINKKATLAELMGSSDEIKKVFNQVSHVAPTDFTVILYGETGSGKELIARAIHNQSLRRDGKIVTIDCGAIPETLLESELFGYEKGAFTGADKRKVGYIELASEGTLFLDEIGNLSLQMQGKLLRAIDEKLIKRLGGENEIEVDVRIIVAGNEMFDQLVKAGKFREDLYHRLNEFTIEIPPLRKRREDVIYLSRRFLNETNRELNKNVRGFSASSLECLLNYDWPGNVRELKNVVRKSVLMADDLVESVNLPNEKSQTNNNGLTDYVKGDSIKLENGKYDKFSLRKVIGNVEEHVIIDVLKHTGGNKSKAARILKIDYKTILYKIKEYGIDTS
ncbi:MAG: sigma-54-dependent transcriptional regulator [Planctomycetota bacterium]|jgi:two-component system nitrogen regulation response regulator GlnG